MKQQLSALARLFTARLSGSRTVQPLRSCSLWAAIVVGLLLLPLRAQSALVVSNTTDSAAGSLRATIASAQSGHVTITGNSAVGGLADGSGIYNASGTLTLTNSIVAGNTGGATSLVPSAARTISPTAIRCSRRWPFRVPEGIVQKE